MPDLGNGYVYHHSYCQSSISVLERQYGSISLDYFHIDRPLLRSTIDMIISTDNFINEWYISHLAQCPSTPLDRPVYRRKVRNLVAFHRLRSCRWCFWTLCRGLCLASLCVRALRVAVWTPPMTSYKQTMPITTSSHILAISPPMQLTIYIYIYIYK